MSEDKDSGYYDMSNAVDELRYQSFGAKETAAAGLKLFGKGLFNVARFAVAEVIPGMAERAADKVIGSDNATDEQRQRAEENKAKMGEVRRHFGSEKK